MELECRKNNVTGEEMYFGKHSCGLEIYIIPKKKYSNMYAVLATRYGSVDSDFVVPGESAPTSVPDGIAHYLEHKMFDQPDGSNVFDQFSGLGGSANAFTSFNITAYLFSATENKPENLAVLLDYVQSPYFTDESVQKEQGIIGQEIKMYDDDGEWKLFFNFLNCLYKNHPVKKEIAGTVESISKITPEYLYKCYNTFYNLSNMALVIVGDTDVDALISVIEKGIKKNEPFSEGIKKIYPEEPEEIARDYSEQTLSVASPLFMAGFKDTDTSCRGDALLKKSIEMNILLGMLFGKSSRFYKEQYENGLINGTFSGEYTMQRDYAYSSLSGESPDPKAVFEAIKAEVQRVKDEGLNEEDFKRMKKVEWGRYLRSLDDVDDYGTAFVQLKFMGIDYFDYDKVYASITFEDIKKRFNKHFDISKAALSVINPAE